MSTSNTSFTFEYTISIIVVLVVTNLLVKSNPQMNTVVVIIAGLLIGYITMYVMNNFFPYLNKLADNLLGYVKYEVMNNFSSMGYMHVWPPILAILVIFIILLYNKNLG
jgi:xanthine/uracil permease